MAIERILVLGATGMMGRAVVLEHVSLPKDTELAATRQVLDLASSTSVGRVTYVSDTSVRAENRLFDLVEVKVRCEGDG